MNVQTIPLKELASFTMGQAPAGSSLNYKGEGVPFYRSGEFGKIRPVTKVWTNTPLREATEADVLVCVVGAYAGDINLGVAGAIGRSVAAVTPGPDLDQDFLYYFLKSQELILRAESQGSVQSVITKNDLAQIEIPRLTLVEQQAISSVLKAFDNKIESNLLATSKILELAKAVVCKEQAAGVREMAISELAQFHNRRRVPLSNQERKARPGNIPYYGATGIFGHVDEAIFDEILVLVGEDGSVVREDGGPMLQYIWGPAWINNHAHPLTGAGISTELLFILLDKSDIRSLVTGAVQPKINMGNLKTLVLSVPEDLENVEETLADLFDLYRTRKDETITLIKARDTLLPALIFGQKRLYGTD